MIILQERYFYIEYTCQYYSGYSTGKMRGKYECPLFTYEEAMKVMANFNDLHLLEDNFRRLFYNRDLDYFYTEYEEIPIEEWESYKPVTLENKKLYPIGSMSWDWLSIKNLSEIEFLSVQDMLHYRNECMLYIAEEDAPAYLGMPVIPENNNKITRYDIYWDNAPPELVDNDWDDEWWEEFQ